MTSSMATPKKNTKSINKATTVQEDQGTPKGFWLYLALGVLTIFSVYVVIARLGLGSIGYLSTSGLFAWAVDPATSSLLMVVFGPLFIYRSIKGYRISPLAKFVAYALISIVVLALLVMIVLSGQCNSIMTNCSMDFWFRLAALYYSNLYVPVFFCILLLMGNVALFMNKSRRSTSR